MREVVQPEITMHLNQVPADRYSHLQGRCSEELSPIGPTISVHETTSRRPQWVMCVRLGVEQMGSHANPGNHTSVIRREDGGVS
jgi:hypothetical protein